MKHLLFACLVLACIILGAVVVQNIFSAKPGISGTIPYDHLDSDTIPLPPKLVMGKKIFTRNCGSCHALHKTVSAPALHGVTQRGPWGNRKNLYSWIRNPASFMSKDPYTRDLREQYGYVMMAFPQLTEEAIDAIIEYVESSYVQNMPVARVVYCE